MDHLLLSAYCLPDPRLSLSELLTQIALDVPVARMPFGSGRGWRRPGSAASAHPFRPTLRHGYPQGGQRCLGLGATGRHWRASSLDLQRSALVLLPDYQGLFRGPPGSCFPIKKRTVSLGLLTLGLGVYSARKPNLGTEDQLRPLTARTVGVGACGLFIIGILNRSLTSGTGLFVTLWLVRGPGSTAKPCSHAGAGGVGMNGTGALVLV